MGGGSQSVRETEQDRALAEVAQAAQERFETTGAPLQAEYIARASGYRMNEATGEYEIDEGGLLDENGNARIDTSDADASNEAAFVEQMRTMDPNQLGQLEEYSRAGSEANAASSLEMAVQQHTAPAHGLVQAARMGQGLETEAAQQHSQLAAQAQQQAYASAQRADGRNAMAGDVVGTVAGAGTAFATTSRGSLASAQTSATRTPGDHHP